MNIFTYAMSHANDDLNDELKDEHPIAPLATTTEDPRLVLQNRDGGALAKVLLVYDAEGPQHDAMVTFLADVQGYHVVQLHIDDSRFDSIPSFIEAFQGITRPVANQNRRDFVLAIFHYSQHARTSRCMYCSENRPDSSKLLKHAFGSAYVNWGMSRCAIVHPTHCCGADSTLLPAKQIEGMAISFETPLVKDRYPDSVWEALATKLQTVRTIDSHKEATRHVRTIQEVVPVVIEDPLTEDEVMLLIGSLVQSIDGQSAKQLALALGTAGIEWDEHAQRAGDRALYLVLRRTILDDPSSGWARVSEWLKSVDQHEAARMCQDITTGGPLLLSNYPGLTPATASASIEPPAQDAEFVGGQNNGTWETAATSEDVNPSDGTHVDRMRNNLLPPYMREALALEQQEGGSEATAAAIEYAQELDRDYERRRLAREMQEYKGGGGSTTLLGGYATRDKLPGKLATAPATTKF